MRPAFLYSESFLYFQYPLISYLLIFIFLFAAHWFLERKVSFFKMAYFFNSMSCLTKKYYQLHCMCQSISLIHILFSSFNLIILIWLLFSMNSFFAYMHKIVLILHISHVFMHFFVFLLFFFVFAHLSFWINMATLRVCAKNTTGFIFKDSYILLFIHQVIFQGNTSCYW